MMAQHLCGQSHLSGQINCFRPRPAAVPAQRAPLRIDCKESRVGKLPVTIPAGVSYKLDDGYVSVKVATFQNSKSYRAAAIEV